MNCAETQRLFSELALGIVASPEREAAESHLAECAICRARFAEIRPAAAGLSAAFAADRQVSAPRADPGAILASARRGEDAARPAAFRAGPPARRRALRWIPLAAAVFLAGVGVGGAAMAVRASQQNDRQSETLRKLAAEIAQLREMPAAIAAKSREDTNAVLVPLIQQFGVALADRDERQQSQLRDLAEWIQQLRRRDAEGIASAIEDTRLDLRLTQNVVEGMARNR
jgi:anti-sigma factor RsiW